jgi:hypothetical protein
VGCRAYPVREEANMHKVLIVAGMAVLGVPALAAETEERGASREAAAGESLAPRPGATIRDTMGAAPSRASSPAPVRDDRLIVEERPPSVSPGASAPQACPAGVPRQDCAR